MTSRLDYCNPLEQEWSHLPWDSSSCIHPLAQQPQLPVPCHQLSFYSLPWIPADSTIQFQALVFPVRGGCLIRAIPEAGTDWSPCWHQLLRTGWGFSPGEGAGHSLTDGLSPPVFQVSSWILCLLKPPTEMRVIYMLSGWSDSQSLSSGE